MIGCTSFIVLRAGLDQTRECILEGLSWSKTRTRLKGKWFLI